MGWKATFVTVLNLSYFIAKRLLLNKHSKFSRVFIKIAILATALSVAAMILADAFVSGFQQRLKEKMYSFMGEMHIMPYTANTTNLIHQSSINIEEVVPILEANQQVGGYAPFIIRPGILRSEQEMEGIKLKGVDDQYRLPALAHLRGRGIHYKDSTYAHEIILSVKTASRLQVQLNDALFLYFIEEGSIFPRIRKLKVVGLYETGMEEIDKGLAICDLRLLQKINSWQPSQVSGFEVHLLAKANADETAEQLNAALTTDIQAVPLSSIFPNIFSWLAMLNNNVLIIFIVMMTVAIVNIITALLLFAIDRISMSGILKAMGMDEQSLQLLHLWHALLVAVIGLIIGNVLALGICLLQERTQFIRLDKDVYGMETAAVLVDIFHLFWINVTTVFVCICSLWIPAYFLRKINVMKAITFK